MPTATVYIESVEGFAGPARCFELDPPLRIGTIEREYVTIWVQAGYGQYTKPEVCLVPATPSGAAAPVIPGAPPTLMRHPGSFVMHDEPDAPDKIDGAYAFALLMLGGYTIAEPEPLDTVADAPVDGAP